VAAFGLPTSEWYPMIAQDTDEGGTGGIRFTRGRGRSAGRGASAQPRSWCRR
jgi:hypothetical protein